MKLNELRDKIHENAKAKGFYDDEINGWAKACNLDMGAEALRHAFFAQKIVLIHSELSEALEADRKDKRANVKSLEEWGNLNNNQWCGIFENTVKNSIEDELTDVIIRVLDLCGYLGIDIEKHIELKMKYNEQREYKHGKNY
jgi:NTP pyrophosphatase (non-canonical NTP hydrolase)